VALKSQKSKILLVVLVLLAVPVLVYLVLRPTGFLGRAFGTPANLLVDAGSSFDVGGQTWQNLAQGGEENARMLDCCTTQIKALGPKYIRIDHVFDYYNTVTRGGDGKLAFNWAGLDLTIGDITASGAKPFISLSYMPSVISRGDINDLPKDWAEWELAVQKLVEHVSGSGGLGLDSVYYEVWNEPDLFGKYKTFGDKSYVELYSHSVIGASRAGGAKAYKIGGPATTGLYENWVKDLLEVAARSGMRVDFISWHRYSKALADFEEDWLKVSKVINNYTQYKKMELIISEYGPNSENDKAYDGYFAAIHTIAVSTLLEGKVNKIFNFEIVDGPGPEKMWGRWGLLTHDKWGPPEPKPRYSAIQFLNRMSGNKVNVAGEGSWVKAMAKEKDGVIKVLIVNYDSSGNHTESVPIKFVNLPFSRFTYTRTDYSGARNSIEVDTQASNTWETAEFFAANTATIIEISPL